MSNFYQDNHVTLYNKDCRHMNELADNSIQCCVTSPPYWGLRKYAGNQDLIWGENHHEHEWISKTILKTGIAGSPKQASVRGSTNLSATTNTCSICGAWRGAYGLEPTPELYVEHSIEILREIRRVLRKDGTCFWNIGDSYAGSCKGIGTDRTKCKEVYDDNDIVKTKWSDTGIKPKDLCLIPFRVAIAAQSDGWWVRSIIIWSKPNPMPESVKDRPTESHEYILLLTKSAKYYWDMEAVREPQQESSLQRYKNPDSFKNLHIPGSAYPNENRSHPHNFNAESLANLSGRNLRSVWEFPTHGYKEAHFATFPEALPERCIKAASKEGDVILDPFAGSGTTLWVAKKLNRKAVGYELSEQYCTLATKRNLQQVIL